MIQFIHPEYRSFQLCINIVVYHYYGETRVYTIRNKVVLYWWATFYSLISLLFGTWRYSFLGMRSGVSGVRKSIITNFSGGNNYTNLMNDRGFDARTNLIWRNLPKTVSQVVDRALLERILQMQDQFSEEEERYGIVNFKYLLHRINRGVSRTIEKEDLQEVLQAIQNYEELRKEVE